MPEQSIQPALDAGQIVVCDRFTDSSIAYQGAGRELDDKDIAALSRFATGGLVPDLTVLLDIAPDVSARRKIADRDRYERDLALLARVRESYIRQIDHHWVRLDADRNREAIASDVYAAVRRLAQLG